MIEAISTWPNRAAARASIVTGHPHLLSAADDALCNEGLEPVYFTSVTPNAFDAELILHDATDADPERLEIELAQLLQATGNARLRPLFTLVRRDQIDQAARCVIGTPTTVLCEPHAIEWRFAFSGALGRASRVNDQSRGDIERLHRMQGEIAEEAGRLSEPYRSPATGDARFPPASVTAAVIRDVIRARRAREAIFHGGLLADPVWDMLLDLKASELEGIDVTTTNLCIASTAPATTALRWIGILEKAELVERYPDPHDRRRMFVRLSARGSHNMGIYLDTITRAGLPLV